MTLDNLIPLIDGQLINHPSVSSFTSITDRVSQVQRGDLFIATDQSQESIDLALEKGAYGIVFDKQPAHLDNETAWIEVASAFEAHLRLLRFHLMPKQIEVFYCDLYTLEYIQMLSTSNECTIIKADMADIVSKLWNLNKTKILILRDQPEILTLFPMARPINFASSATANPVTLYESDIAVDSLLYTRLRLPVVMQEYFLSAIGFFHHMALPFDLNKLTFIEAFYPISCDNFLSPKEFGKGSLNLLFSQDQKLIDAFIAACQTITPWIRVKLFLNQNLRDLSYNNCVIYHDNNELLKVLQAGDFDLGIINEASRDVLQLASKPQQLTFFNGE